MAYNDWNIHGERENWERYADYKAYHSSGKQADKSSETKGKNRLNIIPLVAAFCLLAGMVALYVMLLVKHYF